MTEAITIGWFIIGILGVFLGVREDTRAGRPVRANSVFFAVGGAVSFLTVIVLMILEDTEP